MNRQDWYLNKLDITQYVVRKPNILKGETSIDIPFNIRLLVVASSPPQEKIFQDILKAIQVSENDCLIFTPAQLIMPIEQLKQVIWFIDQPLPESWLLSPQLKEKPIVKTDSLTQLRLSPKKKRQLWNKLCQYEHYF